MKIITILLTIKNDCKSLYMYTLGPLIERDDSFFECHIAQ